jgi:catechol 2,3-dioxygenase-like lactoylglutathione lyase family enzyme
VTNNSRPNIDRFDHLFIRPADFEKSLAFYRDVLGWAILTTWGGGADSRGAVLSGGGIKVVLAEDHRTADKPGSAAARDSRPNVHLDIHSVDLRFRVLPKGEHVVVAPEATHWGTRWFVVRDPDGNLIAFEEHPRGG